MRNQSSHSSVIALKGIDQRDDELDPDDELDENDEVEF